MTTTDAPAIRPDYKLEAANALAIFGPTQLAGHITRSAERLRTEYETNTGDRRLAAVVYAGGLEYLVRYAAAMLDVVGPMIPKAPEPTR